MPLISLVSVKGSPGVTTTALALATVWPAQRRLLAEFDPAGGDLGVRLGLPAGAGLAGLAASTRRPHAHHSLWPFAHELAGGMHVLAAPPGAEQASACLHTLAAGGVLRRLAAGAATAQAVVIADGGRLDPRCPTGQAGVPAGAVLVVARPHLSDLAHLAGRLDAIGQQANLAGLVLVTGGKLPRTDPAYPAREITRALGVRVLGSLPADPRGVCALLAGRGQPAATRRLPLARAARALAESLARAAPAAFEAAAGPVPADGETASAARRAGGEAEVIGR